MIDMDMIVLGIIVALNVVLVIAYVDLKKSLMNSVGSLVDVLFAKMTLDKLTKEETDFAKSTHVVTDEDVHTENFIKFLSDSRDWAFSYIENSMSTIGEVIKHCEVELARRNDMDVETSLSYAHIISRLGTLMQDSGEDK